MFEVMMMLMTSTTVMMMMMQAQRYHYRYRACHRFDGVPRSIFSHRGSRTDSAASTAVRTSTAFLPCSDPPRSAFLVGSRRQERPQRGMHRLPSPSRAWPRPPPQQASRHLPRRVRKRLNPMPLGRSWGRLAFGTKLLLLLPLSLLML